MQFVLPTNRNLKEPDKRWAFPVLILLLLLPYKFVLFLHSLLLLMRRWKVVLAHQLVLFHWPFYRWFHQLADWKMSHLLVHPRWQLLIVLPSEKNHLSFDLSRSKQVSSNRCQSWIVVPKLRLKHHHCYHYSDQMTQPLSFALSHSLQHLMHQLLALYRLLLE